MKPLEAFKKYSYHHLGDISKAEEECYRHCFLYALVLGNLINPSELKFNAQDYKDITEFFEYEEFTKDMWKGLNINPPPSYPRPVAPNTPPPRDMRERSRKEPCQECGRPLSKYFKGDDNEL